MLILKRRTGESLKINTDDNVNHKDPCDNKRNNNNDIEIEVIVLEVQSNQVKLGIKAPDRVKIYRNELYERMVKATQKLITIAQKDAQKDVSKKDAAIDEAESEVA